MLTMRSTLLVRQIQLGKRLTAVRSARAAGLRHEMFIVDILDFTHKTYTYIKQIFLALFRFFFLEVHISFLKEMFL